ncbi:hypothetical protein EA187_09920 [Lujinxingia sediminis]|uniref:TM2 domain-containing protein n=1 Tax=Lujinxingia sediminis TaxID=2480984 RepID=A0ABY0CTC6_9DELT|nr:hypothetical protein [Lujinxingia sediminis]RVU44846.1 hypothetical protein EA187_09920 [Lujinxingia sediminis]
MSSRHQAVLGLFFEEGVTTLSPAHLAYRMGVPVREAEALLDEMVTQDLLALDFSGDHDFGYRLPPGTLPPEPRQAYRPESVSAHDAHSRPLAPSQVPSSYEPAPYRDASYQSYDAAHVETPLNHSSPYAPAQGWHAHAAPQGSSPDGTDGSVGPFRASSRGYAQPDPPHHQPTSAPFAPPSPYAASPFAAAADARRQELVPFRDNLPQQHMRPDRRPFVAGLLSFLFTGLGQVYNGEPLKGALMFATSMLLWFFWMGWVVSMWSIADAYSVAQRAESQGA